MFRILLITSALFSSGCLGIYGKVGGDFKGPPEELRESLTQSELQKLDLLFEDVDKKKRFDIHVHLVGLGTNNSGIEVNRELLSVLHPFKSVSYTHLTLPTRS